MAATQDLSLGSGSSLHRWGARALQVLTRSTVCNVLGTIKPNVSFPELLCSVWGRGGWASGKHRVWLALSSTCSPVGAVCRLGFIFDLFIKLTSLPGALYVEPRQLKLTWAT